MDRGIDVCLFLSEDESYYDIAVGDDGDIRAQDFFDTAILVSIFGERRANQSEVLDSRLRRGWIGNESTPGIEIGSKVWLFEQSRLTVNIQNGIANAVHESLRWLIEQGYAKKINEVAVINTIGGLRLDVTITRFNSVVEKRFYNLWNNTAIKS